MALRTYKAPVKILYDRLPLCVNRKQMVSPPLRQDLTLENQTLGLTLAFLAKEMLRFTNAMSKYDQGLECMAGLKASILCLTHDQGQSLYLRKAMTKAAIASRLASIGPVDSYLSQDLFDGLMADVDLPTVMDVKAFDKMVAARLKGSEISRDLKDPLMRIYTLSMNGTLGDTAHEMYQIIETIRGPQDIPQLLAA